MNSIQGKVLILLCCGLSLLFCLPSAAPGNREMSDEEKKKAVYRMYEGYKEDFPTVRDMSPQRAMELLSQEAVVFVDTRRPEEMAVSRLPGAVSKEDFLSDPERYSGKTVVVYCTISYRSGIFARDIAKKGISLVNLQAGILAWTLEGGMVTDESGKAVKRVHVYGDRWDYPPAGYESVKFGFWE